MKAGAGPPPVPNPVSAAPGPQLLHLYPGQSRLVPVGCPKEAARAMALSPCLASSWGFQPLVVALTSLQAWVSYGTTVAEPGEGTGREGLRVCRISCAEPLGRDH